MQRTFRPTYRALALAGVLALLIAILTSNIVQKRARPGVSSFDECVAAGFPVMESFPAQCRANGRTFVQDIATSTPDRPAGLSSESGNIRVYVPSYGGIVGLPLVIAGDARTFENDVQWRLRDADGTELARGFTTALGGGLGEFGTFTIRSSYLEPKSPQGTVEVFSHSAKDGSEIDQVTLPVTFSEEPAMTVSAYFSDSKRDPQATECAVAYPVTRRVTRTDAPARAALEELLAGVSLAEARNGSFSNIPHGVAVRSLVIEDGTARVDFSGELRAASSGSCRVAAIRSQVEKTLRQFPSVQRVEITVEGEADALEP